MENGNISLEARVPKTIPLCAAPFPILRSLCSCVEYVQHCNGTDDDFFNVRTVHTQTNIVVQYLTDVLRKSTQKIQNTNLPKTK